MRPLTSEQAKTLLEFVRSEADRLKALYVIAVTTGLRQGELLGLKWDDVDLGAGSLQVRRTLVTAKGGPVLSSPKTKGSRRTVKLSQTALIALRSHLNRQLGERYIPGGISVARERSHIRLRNRGTLGSALHHHAPIQAPPKARGPPANEVSRPTAYVCHAVADEER